MSELKRENVEENGHTLGENLEYLRAVYCVHPMVIELLDKFDELMKERDALLARATKAEAERDRAVADLAMSDARCSALHEENKRLDSLVVARGQMVERLIDCGFALRELVDDDPEHTELAVLLLQTLADEWQKEQK